MKKIKIFSTMEAGEDVAVDLNREITNWQADPQNRILEILDVKLAASERTTIVSVLYST